MADNITDEAILKLRKEWDLSFTETLSEEALLQMLADKIVDILAKGPETFFQLMYRLDISEKKLLAVLADENTPVLIARLIYDRQLQKIKSRHEHRIKDLNDDPELNW